MKQSEKLDLILKKLYEYRDTGKRQRMSQIMKDIGIFENYVELERLAKRLRADGLARVVHYMGNIDAELEITSHGIDYCEESSYTKPGYSLITNTYTYNLNGNTNTNIVNNSSQVTTNQSNNNLNEVAQLIDKFKKELNNHEIDAVIKTELVDYVSTIEEQIQANNPIRQFLLKNFLNLSNSSNVATIASLGLQICQLLSIIPSSK